jgi:hypothetical protein
MKEKPTDDVIELSLRAVANARKLGAKASDVRTAIIACEAARIAIANVPRRAATTEQIKAVRTARRACAKARQAIARVLRQTHNEVIRSAISGLWTAYETEMLIRGSERKLAELEGHPFPRIKIVK